MADKNAGWATQMLHHHGFLTRSDVTSRFIGHDTKQDIGRADIFASKQGRAVNIEVKYGTKSWRHHPKWDKKTQKWTQGWHYKQREWAAMSMCPPFETPYWIFLTMGEDPASWNPEKYIPRKSWLIPFAVVWKAVHQIEQAGKLSMPYNLRKGTLRIYQDNGWSASDLFAKYELTWNKKDTLVRPEWFEKTAGQPYGGFWTIPQGHDFYQQFVASQPQTKFDQTNTELLQSMRRTILSCIPDPPKQNKPPRRKKQKRHPQSVYK